MNTRTYWLSTMRRIADPILESLSRGELTKSMPCRFYGQRERTLFCSLEAFGRTFCGFAPFISDYERPKEEETLVQHYRALLATCLDHATNPQSPDYMNFGQDGGDQPLVDAAFLCHGLYRSGSFAENLPEELKRQIIEALKISRRCSMRVDGCHSARYGQWHF